MESGVLTRVRDMYYIFIKAKVLWTLSKALFSLGHPAYASAWKGENNHEMLGNA